MKGLIRLITSFRYGGLTSKEMDMCEREIKKRNIATLSWILPVMLGALCVLFFISIIPGSGEESNRNLYFIFAVALLVQYLVFTLFPKKNGKNVLIMSYIFMLTAYAFGIYEATCIGENSSSTVFCVFLVAVPLLFIDIPIRLAIQTVVVEILLVIIYSAVGNSSPDRFVVLESLCCMALGICYGYVIQKTKFSDIRNHILLEVQRDTDMMTGASSRVAYIRDIGMMSDNGISAGVIFADVNGLKKTNDTYGHEAGDVLIKNAFSLMWRYFDKDSDRIYRVGGDEFVIISIGEDNESFNARYTEMAKRDKDHEIISCGSVWFDSVKDSEMAIKQAEKMMYEEKELYYISHPEKSRRTK